MTRKTLIIGGASGIGFAVGSLLAGRGEEIILAGRDGAKLDAARQRLSAHAASVHTFVLDISREAELVALGETLGEVNNIVVTAGSQAPGGLLSGLDLRAARLAFDTKFWGSINVARYLSGNIAPRGTLTFTSGFVIGAHDGPDVSSTHKSAFAPTATYPQSSRPCESARI